MGFSPTGTMPVSAAATSSDEKNGVFCSSTPDMRRAFGSSRACSAAATAAPCRMWSRQVVNDVLELHAAIVDVDQRVISEVGDGRQTSPLIADSSRCVGQFTADTQQLPGGAADRELSLLGGEEVPVYGVVRVDPDAAVHVHRGVRDPVARVGRPERRRVDVDVRRQVLGQPPRCLGQVNRRPLMSM